MSEPIQGISVRAPADPPAAPAPGAWAMARILTMALLYVAAAVPAFLAGVDVAGWCLVLLGLGLVARFPMAGFCAVMGGGAYLLLTAVAILSPSTFGPSGLFEHEGWMLACSWLTLAASAASLLLMNVPTFTQAFRREGRPVAQWDSVGIPQRS
ncbi:MAG: hypothetical protein HY904_11805 [Deltaproteobacteria bacterium]|nr:hypothetical protein [Deltaproteobacteria bacterium]